MSAVDAGQRFTRRRPCPICGGGDDMPRGKGRRCSGFLSSDARYAYCSREELAGQLFPQGTEPATFRHRLAGECWCGVEHGLAEPGPCETSYVYTDEAGSPLFRTVRLDGPDGKRIWQERLEGGRWVKGLGSVPRVLYGLPAITDAETVHVVEGEPCADVLRELGFVATTSPMGAAKWRPEHADALADVFSVVVWPDSDPPGRAHAAAVVRSLLDRGPRVSVVDLAPEREDGYDVADLIDEGRRNGRGSDLAGWIASIVGSAMPGAQWLERFAPEPAVGPQKAPGRSRKLDGAEFILSAPTSTPAIWGGVGADVGWTPGESLMICGPDGVGKTTVAQQLLLARIGLRQGLLSLPVEPAVGRVLYLALDRPAQAARSMRRMVADADADTLRERLAVWTGPLPVDVLAEPRTLAEWIETEYVDVSDVVVDSLKDVIPKISEDEHGTRYNQARQELLVRGIQVLELHHQRKEQRGQGKPKSLADVHGSRWLTAGAGSVVLLWGEPGDLVVELIHLKQPAEEVGPFKVVHDHGSGTSRVHEPANLLGELAARGAAGVLVADAAAAMFETSSPTANQVEKARRRLNRYVEKGDAYRQDDLEGAARYFIREERA